MSSPRRSDQSQDVRAPESPLSTHSRSPRAAAPKKSAKVLPNANEAATETRPPDSPLSTRSRSPRAGASNKPANTLRCASTSPQAQSLPNAKRGTPTARKSTPINRSIMVDSLIGSGAADSGASIHINTTRKSVRGAPDKKMLNKATSRSVARPMDDTSMNGDEASPNSPVARYLRSGASRQPLPNGLQYRKQPVKRERAPRALAHNHQVGNLNLRAADDLRLQAQRQAFVTMLFEERTSYARFRLLKIGWSKGRKRATVSLADMTKAEAEAADRALRALDATYVPVRRGLGPAFILAIQRVIVLRAMRGQDYPRAPSDPTTKTTLATRAPTASSASRSKRSVEKRDASKRSADGKGGNKMKRKGIPLF